MKSYTLSPEAQQDLRDIKTYLLRNAGLVVSRLVTTEIAKAMRMLRDNPEAGHRREDLTNEPVKFWSVLSYLIVYDPDMRPIGIARVLHARQDLESLLGKNPTRI